MNENIKRYLITVTVIYYFPLWIKAVKRSILPHQSKVTTTGSQCLDAY